MHFMCPFTMTSSNEEKYSTYKAFTLMAGLMLIAAGIIASGALAGAAPAFADKGAVPNFGESGQHLPTVHGKASCVHRLINTNATAAGESIPTVC
jgi:hypothetical protein